jgi:hypothetical protein
LQIENGNLKKEETALSDVKFSIIVMTQPDRGKEGYVSVCTTRQALPTSATMNDYKNVDTAA